MIGLGINIWGTRNVGGAFDPSALFSSGEAGGWYDATILSSLYQDAGTTPVASSGDTIGRIEDQGPNGDHLNQTSASAKPAYRDFPAPHADPIAGDFMTSASVLTSACTVAVLYPSGDVHFRIGTDAGNGLRTDDNFVALVAIDRALTAGERASLLSWFADKAGTLETAYDYYVDPDLGDNGNAGTSPGAAYADLTNLTAAPANTTIGIKRGTLLQESFDVPSDGVKIGAYGSISYTETQVDAEPLIIARPEKPTCTNAVIESGPWSVVSGTEYDTATAHSAPGGNVPVYHEAVDGTIRRLAAGTAGALSDGEFAFSGGSLAVNVGAAPHKVWVPNGAYSFQADGVDDVTIFGLRCAFSSNDGLQYRNGAQRFQADSIDAEWNANDAINSGTATSDALIRNCTMLESGRETDWLGDGFSAHVASTGTIRNCNIRWAAKDCISNSQQGNWTIEGSRLLNGGQGLVVYPEAGTPGAHTVNRCIISGGNGRTGFGAYKVSCIFNNASATIDINNCVLDLGVDLNATARGLRVDTGTMTVRNSIMNGSFQLGFYQASGTLDSDYCDAFGMAGPYTGAAEGPNSLRVDPVFIDAANGDFRLSSGSGVIDQGTTLAGITDQYLGSAPDMGAHEKE
jgi:hypothetical protein